MNVTSVAEIGCEMDRRFEDGTDGTFCWIDWDDDILVDWDDEIGRDDDWLDEGKFIVGCVEYSFTSDENGFTNGWVRGIIELLGDGIECDDTKPVIGCDDEIGIDWGDGIGIDCDDGIGIDWGDDVTPPLDCDEIGTDWDNPVPFTSSLLTPWYCLPYAISNLQLIIFIHFLLNTW